METSSLGTRRSKPPNQYVCVIIKLNFCCYNLSSNYKDKPRQHCVRKCVSLALPPFTSLYARFKTNDDLSLTPIICVVIWMYVCLLWYSCVFNEKIPI